MYVDGDLISVCKVENGYLLEVKVPYKNKEGQGDMAYPEKEEKKFFVATAAEVGEKVGTLLPLLEDAMDADQMFSMAFKDASKKEE